MLRLAVLLGLGQGGGAVQGDGHHQAQSPHAGHRDLTTTHNHPQCRERNSSLKTLIDSTSLSASINFKNIKVELIF